jgi:hypothetical protein
MYVVACAAEPTCRHHRRGFKKSGRTARLPEWGRHVRCSPHSSPELLRELHEFVPRWDVFSTDVFSTGDDETDLRPIEFHDVVQWLKVFLMAITGD